MGPCDVIGVWLSNVVAAELRVLGTAMMTEEVVSREGVISSSLPSSLHVD